MNDTRNPEDDVCDAIAELVDESLAHGPTCDYDRPYLERCALCGYEWHGLTGNGMVGVAGCPGAHATDEQAQRWRAWWRFPHMPWDLPDDPFDLSDWFDVLRADQEQSTSREPTVPSRPYTLADIEGMRGGFASGAGTMSPTIPPEQQFPSEYSCPPWVGVVLAARQEILGTILLGSPEVMGALNDTLRDINDRMSRFYLSMFNAGVRCEQCERYMPGLVKYRDGYHFRAWCAQCNGSGEFVEIRRLDDSQARALPAGA